MLRTKSNLPKYCCYSIDRHGKRRVRFQRQGFSTYFTGTPWGEDFMRQYAAALDGITRAASNVGEGRTLPGSVNALCVSYYRSPDFNNLKASTQAMRRNIIEKFRHQHGTKPIKGLRREHVDEIIGAKSKTPEAANNLLKVLRVILTYAVSLGLIASNPTIGIRKYKSRGDGFHSWTENEIAAFEARHDIGTRPRLAFDLLLYTAQRRSDVLRMGWQHVVTDDLISVQQDKTGTKLMIPINPMLRLSLASVPRTNMTFLITERGAPFTPPGFGNWFRKQCDLAGLAKCSAHGLRKAAATRLADAGCSANQIAAITGHKSLSEVAHYTRAADQERLARQALQLGGVRRT
jgi:integrase